MIDDRRIESLGSVGRDITLPRKRGRRGVLLALAVGAGALGLAYCGGSESSTESQGDERKSDLLGIPKGEARSAPDFAMTVYQGQDELGATDLQVSGILDQGKPVILNFWAGLCPPCRAEMPDFEAVYAASKSKITLLGIDVGPFVGLGTFDQGKSLAAELGVTYPLATPKEAGVLADYKVLGMPTTVFVTADGIIHRVWAGLLSEEIMLELVDELVEASS
ncbi:MAG: TlpA disulfide reductase family protein [Chloroflexi bacterium]|nr:TlpA disulfide reductase family protein [Chloroflexota bacterium]